MDRPDMISSSAAGADVARHDTTSIMLHWITLLLFAVLFASIWAAEGTGDDAAAGLLLGVHRSIGALIFAVTLARLAWKATASRAPAFPSTMPLWQRWAARANEAALYLLLLAQPTTGLAQSITYGESFSLLGMPIPPLMIRNKGLTDLLNGIHEATATALLVLVGVHACAALFHGLVLRDGVLGSMLPAHIRSSSGDTRRSNMSAQ